MDRDPLTMEIQHNSLWLSTFLIAFHLHLTAGTAAAAGGGGRSRVTSGHDTLPCHPPQILTNFGVSLDTEIFSWTVDDI